MWSTRARHGCAPTAILVPDINFYAERTLHQANPNHSQTVREVMAVIHIADCTRVTEPSPEGCAFPPSLRATTTSPPRKD